MVLQLLSRQYSACDVGCPPGFELVAMVTDAHVQSSSIMPSLALVRKDSSPEKTPPSSDDMYVDMTSILACVEDELHISAKVSLADYLDSFVKEELRKSFNSGDDDRLNEVALEVFVSPFIMRTPAPPPTQRKC